MVTRITRNCTIVLDGRVYRKGDYVPGEWPKFGEVTDGDHSKVGPARDGQVRSGIPSDAPPAEQLDADRKEASPSVVDGLPQDVLDETGQDR